MYLFLVIRILFCNIQIYAGYFLMVVFKIDLFLFKFLSMKKKIFLRKFNLLFPLSNAISVTF